MKQIVILFLFTLVLSYSLVQAGSCEDDQGTQHFVDYVTCLKYPVETHIVTTADGYKLTVYRIQAKNTQIKSGKPVILLQHGLLDSSDGWILNNETIAPGLVLANQGHDIWLGNNRGNKYSLDHQTLDSTTSKDYWNFSWMHMADYDLPAMFDYIAKLTGQKINYIGHSQGTVQMFAHLANPNGKHKAITSNLRKFAALGPPVYMANVGSKFFVTLATFPYLPEILTTLFPLGVMHPNWLSSETGRLLCKYMPWACADGIQIIADVDASVDNLDRLSVVVQHYPAGTAINNIWHWGQEIQQNGNFQKFDYGAETNMKVYNQSTPPKYDLSLITEDVALFVGTGDELATALDSSHLYRDMVNSKNKEMHLYDIGHLTFVIGKTLPYMDDLIKFLDIPQQNEMDFLKEILE